MFPLVPFSRELAARATGLSESRIERWVRDGVFSTTQPDHDIGDSRRPVRSFSFGDVVILRALAALREEGIGLEELGQISRQLKSLPDKEWETSRLVVDGGVVRLERGSDVIRGASHNGPHPTVTIPLSRFVREIEEQVHELGRRSPDEIGQVTRKRGILGGKPVLAGTRIPTETIYTLRKSGYDDDWILENYPRLRAPDIAAAIAFEEARRLDRIAS